MDEVDLSEVAGQQNIGVPLVGETLQTQVELRDFVGEDLVIAHLLLLEGVPDETGLQSAELAEGSVVLGKVFDGVEHQVLVQTPVEDLFLHVHEVQLAIVVSADLEHELVLFSIDFSLKGSVLVNLRVDVEVYEAPVLEEGVDSD